MQGCYGYFLVTTVQYLCIGILFNVFGQVSSGTNYVMSVILIVIGALLFIIASPQLVSALLNANTGAGANMSELHTLAALGTSMIAMSKYGKTVDNSTSSNSNTDNSNSDSSGAGADTNMDNSSSNLESASNSASSNEDNNSNSNLNNESPDNSSSDISSSDPEVSDLSGNISDNINMDTTTSLSERIDTYKDFMDNRYSSLNDDTPTYKTNVDWGNINVSNTKEHKS